MVHTPSSAAMSDARSSIVPCCERNARRSFVGETLIPTTCPAALAALAVLETSPGSTPRSMGVCAASLSHITARLQSSSDGGVRGGAAPPDRACADEGDPAAAYRLTEIVDPPGDGRPKMMS